MKHANVVVGILLLLGGSVACSGGGGGVSSPLNSTGLIPSPASGGLSSGRTVGAESATVEPAGTIAIAINAGGGAAGGAWIADTDYVNHSWSSAVQVSNAIDRSHVSNPAPQSVYQDQRYGGGFTYTIPHLTAYAPYTVRLHFAETYFTSSGQRVFNVLINGKQTLTDFDVFKTAGAANRAVIESLNASANGSGQISIALVAVVNYPSIAGVEIVGGASSPRPSPTPTSSPGGDTMPWVYSELWSGSSPFRTTVATQKANGATVVPHGYMDSLWNQGLAGNPVGSDIPLYVASSSDPVLTAYCTMYGGNCNANNMQIHVPSYAAPQQTGDHHITVIDQNSPSGPIELDCWQGSISGGSISCSWAGIFPLGGNGMSSGGSAGIHGAMAVSTVYTTGQEIVNGHIDHTLGMTVACLNNANVYPAYIPSGTDTSCDGSSNPPHYGNLVHLVWSQSQIQQSAYSAPCKVVLTALATYGAYLDDTGNNGLQINTQNQLSYTQNPNDPGNPWPNIESQLDQGGDGQGNTWSSCLNRLGSNDLELIEVAQH